MAKLVESVYGDALFELALEEGRLEEYRKEMTVISDILQENPELIQLLHHPRIEKNEKIEIVEKVFRGKVSDDITGLFVVVVSKNHGDSIESIMKYFLGKVKQHLHIGEVQITSAVELTATQKEVIEQRLLQLTEYSTLETEYIIDPQLIGGLVIRMDNRVVDSSIQTKLERMSKSLKEIQLGNISD